MTNMLTDTDLTVIEALDFDPPCEASSGACGRTAEWSVHISRKCGCTSLHLVCDDHLKRAIASMDEFGNWFCEDCGAKFPLALKGEAQTIDRIEPLR